MNNKDILPILMFGDDKNEITSAKQYAEHLKNEFKNVEKIKQLNIHRCYIIFHDNPKKSKFLKDLEMIYEYHAGSCTTGVFLYKNSLVAIAQLGGPAAVNLMEELSVFGIDEFVAVGSAGCLDVKVKNKLVIVSKAIRDEGASYHYLKPSTFVLTSSELNKEIETYLKENKFDYTKGITRTTDAYFRGTQKKTKLSKNLGAVCVEMECASWAACAKFRGFKFSQILYFSDVVINIRQQWQRITKTTKEALDKKEIIAQFVKNMIDDYSKK